MPFQRCPPKAGLPERWWWTGHGASGTVVPSAGMNLVSLALDGVDHLALPLPLPEFVASLRTGGVPILHPWANRLRGDRWSFDGREVDASCLPDLKRDGTGLPMHGLLLRESDWTIDVDGDDGLLARLDFDDRHPAFGAFPFEHRLEVSWHLHGGSDGGVIAASRLAVEAGGRDVPLGSGWHPYLRPCEGVDPGMIEITTPVLRRAILDDRGLPRRDSSGTIEFDAPATLSGPLGDRRFDDLFAVGDGGWTASVSAGGVRVSLVADDAWPWMQVFTPAGSDAVCLEPMLAPTAALSDGAGRRVAAGARFEAGFEIHVVREGAGT